jgi:hypothetical protein
MAERRRLDLPPRWLSIGEAAQYLGQSPSWLIPEDSARVQEAGCPRVDPSLGGIDRQAIDDRKDRRTRRQGASPPPGHLYLTPPEGAQFANAKIHLRKLRPNGHSHTRLFRTVEANVGDRPRIPGLSINVS